MTRDEREGLVERKELAWERDAREKNEALGAVAGVNYYPGVECEHGHDFCPICDEPVHSDSEEG